MKIDVQKIRSEYIEIISKHIVNKLGDNLELKSLKRLSTGDLSILAEALGR